MACWSYAVTKMMCDGDSASIIRRATSNPVRPGICTSRNTTSGRRRSIVVSASTPLPAWPMTVDAPGLPEQEAQLVARQLLVVHQHRR